MAQTTAIEWADATINPWWGCTKVSPACTNCYAERTAKRRHVGWGPGADRQPMSGWRKTAMQLNRKAEREGRRLRVFSLSMGDWLDPEVPAAWLAELLSVIHATAHLDWLLLTKRPELFRERLAAAMDALGTDHDVGWVLAEAWSRGEVPPNVWVGVTAENQEWANKRVPELMKIPAVIRFLSVEPMLGPVDLSPWAADPIHWVICGGEAESGMGGAYKTRPMPPEWARSLRDQCRAGGIAFFFKQWGAHLPCPECDGEASNRTPGCGICDGAGFTRPGKRASGRALDGRVQLALPVVP